MVFNAKLCERSRYSKILLACCLNLFIITFELRIISQKRKSVVECSGEYISLKYYDHSGRNPSKLSSVLARGTCKH